MEKKRPIRKRGKQKKADQKNGTEDIKELHGTGSAAMMKNSPTRGEGAYDQDKQPGLAQGDSIDDAMPRFEDLVEADDFFMRVHEKIMRDKYPNYIEREEGYSRFYKKIYKRVVNRKRRRDAEQLVGWWNVITRSAAEKICEMINHILCSGPLMEAEVDILDRCVDLLKAYYAERAELISGDTVNKGYYYKYTYFPMPNTYAYRIFISKYDVSTKMN